MSKKITCTTKRQWFTKLSKTGKAIRTNWWYLCDWCSHIEKSTSYSFNSNNKLLFRQRTNRKTDLKEFYNLIYQYQNDCLIAGFKYKKTYYQDRDLKPTEDLIFTVTLFPLTQYEQKVDQNLYRD